MKVIIVLGASIEKDIQSCINKEIVNKAILETDLNIYSNVMTNDNLPWVEIWDRLGYLSHITECERSYIGGMSAEAVVKNRYWIDMAVNPTLELTIEYPSAPLSIHIVFNEELNKKIYEVFGHYDPDYLEGMLGGIWRGDIAPQTGDYFNFCHIYPSMFGIGEYSFQQGYWEDEESRRKMHKIVEDNYVQVTARRFYGENELWLTLGCGKAIY
ncbi:MAG: hypothetical protein SNI70_06965 [Rikenellaceae bacterium]